MKDSFGREIDYARISVTDLCNFRCLYCMGEKGVAKKAHSDILSFEEIEKIVKALALLGIKKLRITGGEPLVRRGVPSLIGALSGIEGIKEIGVTTNGTLLATSAEQLYAAGVTALNVSIDTLDAAKYQQITRCGVVTNVIEGICAAKSVGFENIKINAVLLKDFNDKEIRAFAEFGAENGVLPRFIEFMPFTSQRELFSGDFISMDEVIKREKLTYIGDKGSGNARYYAYKDGLEVGFIGAVSHKFCDRCSRVRVTADGKLLTCLHSSTQYDLKPHLADGMLKPYIEESIKEKPKEHNLDCGILQTRRMDSIGG